MADLDDELLEAAETGNLAAVTSALQRGANVNARDGGFGRTALMSASMRSLIPIMRVLLEAGAQVNLHGALGETALILAASGRGGESIEVLLAGGADPNRADRDKKTPLMWMVDPQFHRGSDTSASSGRWSMLGHGSMIGISSGEPSSSGRSVAWVRPSTCGPGSWPRWSSTALTSTSPTSMVETALFHLVRFIDDALALQVGPPCIQTFLDAGADRNAVNHAGQTPLAVVNRNNPLVIELLRDLGFTEPESGTGRLSA